MISPSSTSIRPVTVAPSRISGGGWARPTLTSKVRVTGSACAADLAHPAGRPDARLLGQEDRDLRVRRGGADHLRRHVEDGVAPALAREPDDHLPGLHHLAGLRPHRGHHALGVRLELGEADLILREPELRLRRLDLGARRLPHLARALVNGARREAALLELTLALVLVLGLAGLALGRRQVGFGRAQRVDLVLRLQPADRAARPRPCRPCSLAARSCARQPEGEPRLVLRLHPAGQHDRHAGCAASRR